MNCLSLELSEQIRGQVAQTNSRKMQPDEEIGTSGTVRRDRLVRITITAQLLNVLIKDAQVVVQIPGRGKLFLFSPGTERTS